ncbi:hypothetical protein GCM10027514_17350 [Azotobacter armeniacus]
MAASPAKSTASASSDTDPDLTPAPTSMKNIATLMNRATHSALRKRGPTGGDDEQELQQGMTVLLRVNLPALHTL